MGQYNWPKPTQLVECGSFAQAQSISSILSLLNGVFDLHTNPNPIHLNRLYRLLNLIHFCCRSNLRGLWLIYVKCRLNQVKMVISGLTSCWDSIQYFATLIMITRSNSDLTHSIPKNFKIVGPFVMIVNYYKWIEYEYFTEFFYSLLLW